MPNKAKKIKHNKAKKIKHNKAKKIKHNKALWMGSNKAKRLIKLYTRKAYIYQSHMI